MRESNMWWADSYTFNWRGTAGYQVIRYFEMAFANNILSLLAFGTDLGCIYRTVSPDYCVCAPPERTPVN